MAALRAQVAARCLGRVATRALSGIAPFTIRLHVPATASRPRLPGRASGDVVDAAQFPNRRPASGKASSSDGAAAASNVSSGNRYAAIP